MYGCETLSVTFTEEHRLRVFENEVIKKIFGAMREGITGEWTKIHNTELHALYSFNIIRNLKSRRLRWAGHMEQSRNAYRVLVDKPEGKTGLGSPRCRSEDSIKMELREVCCDPRHWIALPEDRNPWWAYVRAVMNLWVP